MLVSLFVGYIGNAILDRFWVIAISEIGFKISKKPDLVDLPTK